MIFDEKRDVSSWQIVGSTKDTGLGPGSYTSALTNAGSKSQVGLVEKKKELADFFPNSYKPKKVAFGSYGTEREMLRRSTDAFAVAGNPGGYVQAGRGGAGAIPGPGSYLDMSQDSSFVTAAKTNEQLNNLKRLRKGRVLNQIKMNEKLPQISSSVTPSARVSNNNIDKNKKFERGFFTSNQQSPHSTSIIHSKVFSPKNVDQIDKSCLSNITSDLRKEKQIMKGVRQRNNSTNQMQSYFSNGHKYPESSKNDEKREMGTQLIINTASDDTKYDTGFNLVDAHHQTQINASRSAIESFNLLGAKMKQSVKQQQQQQQSNQNINQSQKSGASRKYADQKSVNSQPHYLQQQEKTATAYAQGFNNQTPLSVKATQSADQKSKAATQSNVSTAIGATGTAAESNTVTDNLKMIKKKRTVPSIPIAEKEERPIGPWSYTPKDDLLKHKATNGLIYPSQKNSTLPQVVPLITEDQKLRQLAQQYLSTQPSKVATVGILNRGDQHSSMMHGSQSQSQISNLGGGVYLPSASASQSTILKTSAAVEGGVTKAAQKPIAQSNSTVNLQQNNSTQDIVRERTLVKKVSKVSILQTARKIQDDRVLTEQRLIPLTQQTKIKASDIDQMKNPSSQFASRVFRGDIFNSEVAQTPGPGSYQGLTDIKKDRWMQANILERGSKRVGFGSQAERKTHEGMILEEQLAAGDAIANQKKRIAQASSTFQIETYDATINQDDFREEMHTSTTPLNYSFSRKQITGSTKANVSNKGVLHSSVNRRKNKKNFGSLNNLQDMRSEFTITPKEVPLVQSLSGIYKAQFQQDEVPGPGHYQLNIPDQIKLLTDKLAPRYKQNPFGSNISRFSHKTNKSQTPAKTEEEVRVAELIRDLEDHTGVSKEMRPGIKTGKLMQQIIKKSVAKLKREEMQVIRHMTAQPKVSNAQAQTSAKEHSDGSKQQFLTEIASSMNPHTIDSMYMILSDDRSPGQDSNPLAQFISIPDSNQEEDSKLAITQPVNNDENNKRLGIITTEDVDKVNENLQDCALSPGTAQLPQDIAGTPGLISDDTSSIYINIAGQTQILNNPTANDLQASSSFQGGAKHPPYCAAHTNKQTTQNGTSKLLGMLQQKKASLAAAKSAQNNGIPRHQMPFSYLANNIDTQRQSDEEQQNMMMVLKVKPTKVSKILVKPVDQQKSTPSITISSEGEAVNQMGNTNAHIEDQNDMTAFGVISEQQSQEDIAAASHYSLAAKAAHIANRLSPDLIHVQNTQAVTTQYKLSNQDLTMNANNNEPSQSGDAEMGLQHHLDQMKKESASMTESNTNNQHINVDANSNGGGAQIIVKAVFKGDQESSCRVGEEIRIQSDQQQHQNNVVTSVHITKQKRLQQMTNGSQSMDQLQQQQQQQQQTNTSGSAKDAGMFSKEQNQARKLMNATPHQLTLSLDNQHHDSRLSNAINNSQSQATGVNVSASASVSASGAATANATNLGLPKQTAPSRADFYRQSQQQRSKQILEKHQRSKQNQSGPQSYQSLQKTSTIGAKKSFNQRL